MKCSQCGTVLAANIEFCGRCGQKAPPPSAGAPLSGQGAWGLRDAPAKPIADTNGIRLSHGEVVKGVFEIANIHKRLGWLEARLIVTDSRVMYQASARNFLNRSVVNREVHLDEINGLGVTTIKGQSPAGFVASAGAVLLSLLGLIPAGIEVVQGYGYVPVVWLGWALVWALIAAVTYFGMRGTRLTFLVYSGDTSNSPIGLASSTGFGLLGGFISLITMPFAKILELMGVTEAGAASTNASLEETLELYHSVGALILDLQNRGVLADQAV